MYIMFKHKSFVKDFKTFHLFFLYFLSFSLFSFSIFRCKLSNVWILLTIVIHYQRLVFLCYVSFIFRYCISRYSHWLLVFSLCFFIEIHFVCLFLNFISFYWCFFMHNVSNIQSFFYSLWNIAHLSDWQGFAGFLLC